MVMLLYIRLMSDHRETAGELALAQLGQAPIPCKMCAVKVNAMSKKVHVVMQI